MRKKAKKPVPFTLESALAMKEKARKVRRKLSFGEKIERMEALRERLAPLKRAREARRRKTGSTAFGK
jgi:hypothetical protein